METTSKAKWIWYPGDFEVWLGNRFNNRRTERGAMFPPFWKQDSHWVTVEFSTTVRLDKAETIEIKCEGDFNMMLDGKLQFGMPESFTVPAGEHRLNFKVHNQATRRRSMYRERQSGATPHGLPPTRTKYGLTRTEWLTARASTCLPPHGVSTVRTLRRRSTGWSARSSVL